MSFPIHRVNARVFPADFRGEVFVCDIDRTYLMTRFSSLKGIAQIPIEFAIDKQAIEGMVVLLKEVRRGPGTRSRQTPLYFLSASPRQLRPVIERKMLLDGLEFDGTTFKDWGKVLLSLTPGRLREQVGFKVTALVAGRQDLPAAAEEVLIGDDLESDALSFALYADYLAGRLDEAEVLFILRSQGVSASDVDGIRRLRRLLPTSAGVKRAYVRLERAAHSPETFLAFAPGVIACRGALQMALAFHEQGSISRAGVLRVARDLAARGVEPGRADELLTDAFARGLVGVDTAVSLRDELAGAGLLRPAGPLPAVDLRWAEAMAKGLSRPWTPTGIRKPDERTGS